MTAQFQTVSVNKTVYQTFLRRMRYKTAQDYRLPFVFSGTVQFCATLQSQNGISSIQTNWSFIEEKSLSF